VASILAEKDSALSNLTAITKERDDLKRQLDASRQTSAQQAVLPATTNQGPINWNPDFQLVVTGGGPEAIINGIVFQGTSASLVKMKEAYAVSGLTGHRQELMANVQYKGYYPVDKVDIPPQASVQLDIVFKPALSIKDFLDQWGKFQITAIYNETTYKRLYDEDYVRRWLRQIPGAFGPRMTPREDK
jgi:hypothetical protein